MNGPKQLTPNQALATFALQLVNNSHVATDDNSLEGVRQVKAWLSRIASGETVVGVPVPVEATKGKRR